jgi:molecular chaperone GrpE (heat shock protein)
MSTVDVETLRTALAELEDAKLRVRRDAEQKLEMFKGQVLEKLLPVLDNLERSIAAGEGRAGGPWLDGVKLVHAQFLAALADFGLERRSAEGARFDPRMHDAVAVVPVLDPALDGVVVGETEPGYWVGDRVIRPAKVQVGRSAARPPS